jgi:alpha/beta superfamily hydrolase
MMIPPAKACRVRVDSVRAGALDLEARFGEGARGGAVVAAPHPLYGGTLDNPVVLATADALRKNGMAALSFNYRGVERSEGTATDDLESAVEDYRAAFDALRARAPDGPYVAAGYSFGAGAALLMARDEPAVAGVVLVAPPVGMLRQDDLRAFAGRVLVVVGDDDEYAPLDELKDALAVRPDATLSVIVDEGHFFHFGGLAELGRQVAAGVAGWP